MFVIYVVAQDEVPSITQNARLAYNLFCITNYTEQTNASHHNKLKFHVLYLLNGDRGGAVGSGTALQVAGSIPDGVIAIFH